MFSLCPNDVDGPDLPETFNRFYKTASGAFWTTLEFISRCESRDLHYIVCARFRTKPLIQIGHNCLDPKYPRLYHTAICKSYVIVHC